MIDERFSQDTGTAELMEQILYEVKRVVVGQDRFLELSLIHISEPTRPY